MPALPFEVLPDADAAARRAADHIAARAREAIAGRGRFVVAFSGGRTPEAMFRFLAKEEIDWAKVHIAQVDERIAPAGSSDRNLSQLRAALLDHVSIPKAQVHAMPVKRADLDVAVQAYGRRLAEIAGAPPVLDLVHLGLGGDGHTASLVPGDAALDVTDADVATTGPYAGRRRMTLTLPIINRARGIVWLVTGAEKSAVVARLLRGDETMPAGRVNRASALLLVDQEAAPKTE